MIAVMAQSNRTVSSLGDALARADEYEAAVGFVVAPLNSLAGSRSWHFVNFKDRRWVQDNHDDDSDEPLPTWVPLNMPFRRLPPLPPSKISRWALAFVDENGKHQRPEIVIWPADEL